MALSKDDDPLAERAQRVLDAHEGELQMSLVTFVDLVEERFAFDRERAVTAMLELATFEGDPDVAYRASDAEGSNAFDAFHAACSDGAYDSLDGIGMCAVGTGRDELICHTSPQDRSVSGGGAVSARSVSATRTHSP